MRVRERDLCTRSLKDNGRAAATPQRDELEAGPGHGPCPNHARFRAPPGAAGEEIKPTRSARPVTDQGQLCISSVLGHARLDPINGPRDRDIKPSAAAVALTTTASEASPPLSAWSGLAARPRGCPAFSKPAGANKTRAGTPACQTPIALPWAK